MKNTYITLNNGIKIPQLGLGVWQMKDGSEVQSAIRTALTAGYRMIDTAAAYGNERGVGQAIAQANIPRSDLHITTKLWNADQGFTKTLAAYERSARNLSVEYIDMYLIHWPMPAKKRYIQSWKAMEQLQAEGKVKSIGVCNFSIEQLQHLLNTTTIVPAVNQIEVHPYFPQTELRQFCKDHGIAVTSYSPLGGSKSSLLTEPLLEQLARIHEVSTAQVVIRWHLQHELIVIPKSVRSDRIVTNGDVFDFTLSEVEMDSIDHLRTDVRVGINPDNFNSAVPTKIVQLAHQLRLVHW